MKLDKLKYSDKTPLPNSFLAEQAILNILLTNPLSIKEAVSSLKSESFYFDPHKILYEIILQLSEKNETVSLTTVITKLQDNGLLTKIGGLERIYQIISKFENFVDLNYYIRIVNEKYLRRLIIEFGKNSIVWGYKTSETIESILSNIERSIFNLNQENHSQDISSVAEVIDDIFNEIKNRASTKDNTSGFITSFKDIDAIIQGFQKSDLIIIAGRPSMGKTAFSLHLGKNIVEKYRIPLIIFTLEMSRQQIIYRLISNDSNITTNRLKSGKMTANEWSKLSNSMQKISDLPIYIDDNPNLTIINIRSKLRKLININEKKEALIIIDYLQLMKVNLKLENRVQEISYITRNLKILAKEFQIPIILLSQLSRNVESRINKRPMLSDLRESGCFTVKNHGNEYISWLKKKFVFNNENINIQFKGCKPVFTICFHDGNTVELTSNHKILSKNGWIRVSQLNKMSEVYYLIKKKQEKNYFYKYQKIKKILYQGIHPVYDNTIPLYHNFFKNNLILHNSIEQDADIVILLYREDYYLPKNQNLEATEIIIAKHRNGSIGTAKLNFNLANTSFKNVET